MTASGLSILALEGAAGRPGDETRAEVRIEAHGRWFAGHFPGAPILPAIAHLDLLCRVHRAAGGCGRLARIGNLRLTRPVAPGERLLVTLAPALGDGASAFAVRTPNGETASAGSVVWATEDGVAGDDG